MAIDKTLGVRLELITAFQAAAKSAVTELRTVTVALAEVKKAGARSDTPGIKELQNSIDRLSERITAAVGRVDEFGNTVTNTGRKSRKAAADVAAVGEAAVKVAAEADVARTAILRLGTSIGNIPGTIAVDRVGNALHGVVLEAVAAKRAVDEFEASLRRLPTTKVTRLSVEGSGYNQTALNPARPGETTWYPRAAPMVAPGLPQGSLPSQYRPMLMPGSPGPAMAAGGLPQGALPAAERLMLTGGTDPYYNARAWDAQQRAKGSSFGSGPPIVVPPGGSGGGPGGSGPDFSAVGGFGKRLNTVGKEISSAGFGATIAGSLGVATFVPMIKTMADLDDLAKRNIEAFRAAGATQGNAEKLNAAMSKATAQFGGDYRTNTAGIYNFVSAAPQGLTDKINTPEGAKALTEVYKRQIQLGVAGGSSTHPIDQGTLNLDVLAGVNNLGYDTSTPKKFVDALKKFQNVTINVKNRTSTEADLFAESAKALGSVAKNEGINPTDVIGLIAILAENKIRGSAAGNQLKRILSREALTPKKLYELQAFAGSKEGGGANLSLYDGAGKVLSPLDMIANIAKYQKDHNLTDKAKAQMNGLFSGLYAAPAMGALISFSQKNGNDPKKLHAYAESFVTGKQDPKGKGDALDQAYATRSNGNFKVEEGKTFGNVLNEMAKTFKLIEPDLVLFLKGVNGMVEAFTKLPDPVRRFIVDGALIGTGLLVASGVILLVGGNLLSLGGLLIRTGASIATFASSAKLLGFIGGIGPMIARVAVMFSGVFASALGVAGVAVRGLLAVLIGNPIGLAITALITVGTLLYFAWTRDWGGIREKTAAFVSDVSRGFGIVVRGATEMWNGASKWFGALGKSAEEAKNNVVHWLQALVSDAAKFVGDWVHSGEAMASNFIKGIVGGFTGGVEKVKGALKHIGNLFPHSEPKDSSSPLYGASASGAAHSDMFISGMINAITTGGGKIKKAHKDHVKKPIMDVLIELHNESIAQVEKTANAMEAVLASHGARMKKVWMDLVTPNGVGGYNTTRVQGDPTAYRNAARDDRNKGPNYARIAGDYTKHVLDGGITETSEKTALAYLKSLIHSHYDALGAHGAAEIDHMATRIQKALKAAEKKIADAHARLYTPFFGKDGLGGAAGKVKTEFGLNDPKERKFNDDAGNNDDRLARIIELRKNKELPTLKELHREREQEIKERIQLSKDYNQEIDQRGRIVKALGDLQARLQLVNGADKDSVALRTLITGQLAVYNTQLDDLNLHLEGQLNKVNQVTEAIGKYNTQIAGASNANQKWAALLVGSFNTATKTTLDGLAGSFSSSIDGMIERVLGSKGKKGSPFQAAIGTFVGSFVKSMLDGLVKSMIDGLQSQLSGFFSGVGGGGGFFGKLFGGGKSTHGGGTDAISKVLTDNLDTNGTLDNTLQSHLGPGGTLDSTISKLAASPASVSRQSAAGAAVSGYAGDATINPDGTVQGSSTGQNIYSKIAHAKSVASRISGGVGGAYAAYEGFKTGGVSGGLETGIGVLSTIESIAPHFGPWGIAIAGAAGLIAMLTHHDDPAKMPDKYNARQFTDIQAELLGNNSHASGYTTPTDLQNDSTLQQTGGVGELQYIQDYLKAGGAGLSAAQKADFVKKFGTTGGGLSYQKDIGQEAVVGGSLKGSYTDISNAANDATAAILKLKAGAITAAQNANALAASFTSLMLGGPQGFSIPLAATGAGSGSVSSGSLIKWGVSAPGSGSVSSGSVIGSAGGAAPVSAPSGPPMRTLPIVIKVLENAQIANGDAHAIATTVASMMPGIVNQIRRTNYQDSRLYSRYIPVTS